MIHGRIRIIKTNFRIGGVGERTGGKNRADEERLQENRAIAG